MDLFSRSAMKGPDPQLGCLFYLVYYLLENSSCPSCCPSCLENWGQLHRESGQHKHHDAGHSLLPSHTKTPIKQMWNFVLRPFHDRKVVVSSFIVGWYPTGTFCDWKVFYWDLLSWDVSFQERLVIGTFSQGDLLSWVISFQDSFIMRHFVLRNVFLWDLIFCAYSSFLLGHLSVLYNHGRELLA